MRLSKVNSANQPVRMPRRKAIVAALSIALSLCAVAEHACATNLVVNTCSDATILPKGRFSLRHTVQSAAEGDTVDLSTLTCSTITLVSGEIAVPLNKLTLTGSSSHRVVIDAHHTSRILNHSGTGLLYAENITFSNGYTAYDGGCIDSQGIVRLSGVTLSGCNAVQNGGGVEAKTVDLISSTVTGNSAFKGGGVYASYVSSVVSVTSNNSANFAGGGFFAPGFYLRQSSMLGNSATEGGGAIYGNNGSIQSSRLSGNFSSYQGGAVFQTSTTALPSAVLKTLYSTFNSNTANDVGGAIKADSAILTNTTLSGNHAKSGGGASAYTLVLDNSTVAFNCGAARSTLKPVGGIYAKYMTTNSSIIANNLDSGGGARPICR